MGTMTISRNMVNAEMKRFGRFSKKLAGTLGSVDISIDIIFDARKSVYLKTICFYDTVVFIAHGSSDTIYHKYDHKYGDHQPLITCENTSLLKNKKVVSFACGTARRLGPKAVADGCTAYLGFKTKIHMDKADKSLKASEEYRTFLKSCYKDAFAISLEEAILNHWTFAKMRLRLQERMSYLVKTRSERLQQTKPKFFEAHGFRYALLAVSNVAENIVVFGDDQASII